jgi:HPt (histidine-containing phosphotransfer) domain-containing protein
MHVKREGILDGEVIASLRELNEEGGPDLLAELVQLFLEDTPGRIADLCRALDGRDHGALERAAHGLKSSSANLGAIALSKLFRELESAGRNHDLDRATSLVRASREEYERVREALRSEISAS